MVDQRVAAEKQNGVGTPYIPPMTRRLKCRIDPEQSPYTCMLPEHKPVRRGREMIVDVDYPTRGTYQTVGCPIKLSDSPVAVSRPPLLGEHTDVLLESLCGVEPDEAKRLRQEGVV